MNTKTLMMVSAVFTAIIGITASFLPAEILSFSGLPSTTITTLFMQITGALYLGFAIMNWMAKAVLIGGIYARPLCLGNLLHFAMVAIALIKAAANNPNLQPMWPLAGLYTLFAISFGIVLVVTPKKQQITAR